MSEFHRILLVDDDKDACEMMSVLLRLANSSYEVVSANSAQEALTIIETKSFDVYIIDSLLPDMSGVELCAKLRRRDDRVPILFYSGLSDGNYIKNAKEVGANEYLIKPNDLDRLPETIQIHLR